MSREDKKIPKNIKLETQRDVFYSYSTMAHGPDTATLLKRIRKARNVLDVSGLNITSLPTLPTGLQELNCSYTQITSLPELPAGLQILSCSNTQITSLPELPAGLKELSCSSNTPITSLPTLPAGLKVLDCGYIQITSLPTLPAELRELYCNHTPITSLPELPAGLQILNCSYTPITSLPELPAGLRLLNCSYSQITSLPTLPARLQKLYVTDTQISQMNPNESMSDYIMRMRQPQPQTQPQPQPQPQPQAQPIRYSFHEHPKEIPYTLAQFPMCFDIVMQEDVPILDAISSGNIVFQVGGQYISTSMIELKRHLDDPLQTRYACPRQKGLAVYKRDTDTYPYTMISLTGNFLVSKDHLMQQIAKSIAFVFELVDTGKTLPYTVAEANIMDGLNAGNVNLVSADHCQAGSERKVYELQPLTFTLQRSGGKRRHKTYRRRNQGRKTYKR